MRMRFNSGMLSSNVVDSERVSDRNWHFQFTQHTMWSFQRYNPQLWQLLCLYNQHKTHIVCIRYSWVLLCKEQYCSNNRSYTYSIQTAFMTGAEKEMQVNFAGSKTIVWPFKAGVHWLWCFVFVCFVFLSIRLSLHAHWCIYLIGVCVIITLLSM